MPASDDPIISFDDIGEGEYYVLDWFINGVENTYVVHVEKKNNDTNTVYVRLMSHPLGTVLMVCYRYLIDAPTSVSGDHTWLRRITLKVDRVHVVVDR
jgi:hypothetical protein